MPSLDPPQLTFVTVSVTVIGEGSVIVTELVDEHPLRFVTIQEYKPAESPEIDAVVSPVDQRYVAGIDPDITIE